MKLEVAIPKQKDNIIFFQKIKPFQPFNATLEFDFLN